MQVLGPDINRKSKCVTVDFGKLWTTDLDNFEHHTRSGLHFPKTVGYMIHCQSSRRNGCCANDKSLSSIPTPAKANLKAECPKSPLFNLFGCRTAQRKKEKPVSKNLKEEEKSLSALHTKKGEYAVGT